MVLVRTPFYSVKMEGIDITPWVHALTIVEDDRQADSVSITIPDPRMIYADALFEGCTVEIDAGYAESKQHALMLRAIITKIEASYPENGTPSLVLKGEDKSILMALKESQKVWKDIRISDIVRTIGKNNGFKHIEVSLHKDHMVHSKPIHQGGKTDLAFLQDLARKYHAKCFVELDEHGAEVLYFIPERRLVTLRRPKQLVLSYRMGPSSNLISFTPSFDSNFIDRLKQVNGIDQNGNKIESEDKNLSALVIWDLQKERLAQANEQDKQRINTLYTKGKACKDNLQKLLTTRHIATAEVAPDKDELESINDLLESLRLGMSANGTTFGNIWLRAKSNITIDGVSERFNGDWYVSRVTHQIDTNGYKTEFKCIR